MSSIKTDAEEPEILNFFGVPDSKTGKSGTLRFLFQNNILFLRVKGDLILKNYKMKLIVNC